MNCLVNRKQYIKINMKSDTVEEAIKILKDLRYLPTVKWTYKIIMIIKYIKVRDKNIFWFKIYLMRYAENENRKNSVKMSLFI